MTLNNKYIGMTIQKKHLRKFLTWFWRTQTQHQGAKATFIGGVTLQANIAVSYVLSQCPLV